MNVLNGFKSAGTKFLILFKRERRPNTISIYSYPPLIFLWMVWLLGFLLYFPLHYQWINPTVAGWMSIVVFSIAVLALGFDMSRDETIFTVVFVICLYVLGLWLRDVKHFMFFSSSFKWFRNLKPDLNADYALVSSIIMTIFGVRMFVKTRINDRWTISPNSIEHYRMGSSDVSISRGAKTVSYEYPDMIELLLLGSGTILIYSPDGTRLQRKIPHVPLLWFREKQIDRLAESVAVKESHDLEIHDNATGSTIHEVAVGAEDGDGLHPEG